MQFPWMLQLLDRRQPSRGTIGRMPRMSAPMNATPRGHEDAINPVVKLIDTQEPLVVNIQPILTRLDETRPES
jgi:hypothetical protein